jgi:hypothetical protein
MSDSPPDGDVLNSPADGDVLITTEGGRHLLSVVPHPHRLSLSEFATALQIAKRWADEHNVRVWHQTGDNLTMMPPD